MVKYKKMKKLITLLLIIFIGLYNAQKKHVYYNEDMKEINKTEFFTQRDYSKNIDLYFDDNGLQKSILVRRKNYGKLTDLEFKGLKKSLSSTLNFNKNLIVIVYYPGKDKYNDHQAPHQWNVFDNNYQKKLNRINSYDHFWVYKEYDGLEQENYPDQIHWQADKNNFVEDLFFKNHYPFFSFVVINKRGDYISYFSEFGKDTVWKICKELTKTGK